MKTTNQLLAGIVGLCIVIVGCDSGPPKAQVKGKVTLDGVPLKDGIIEFFPIDGKGQTAGVGILNGEFSTTASPGEMKVTISAVEVIGKHKAYDTPDSPMIDETRNLIPKRYNTESELKVTLKAGPNEGVQFDLISDAKKK
jgi:hypothetical protein